MEGTHDQQQAQSNIKVGRVEPVWFKTNLAHNADAAVKGSIADYNMYRKQPNAATQKGICCCTVGLDALSIVFRLG